MAHGVLLCLVLKSFILCRVVKQLIASGPRALREIDIHSQEDGFCPFIAHELAPR